MRLVFILTAFVFFLTNNSYSQKIYKNSEECILDRIILAKNAEASLAIIEACKKLYPTLGNTSKSAPTIDKKKIEAERKILAEIMELLKVELNKLSN